MYSQLQLEAAINRLMRAESEAEQDVMCAEISKHVADPSWMDLIFQSNEFVMPDGSLMCQKLPAGFSNTGPSHCDAWSV